MSENINSLIETLRRSSAKDSITPDSLGYLLQAIRTETAQLIAHAASAGTVDLSPITQQLATLDSNLSYHLREVSDIPSRVSALETSFQEILQEISSLKDMFSEAEVTVNAPALLPFYGIVTTGITALNESTLLKTRAIFDAKNGRFVAQAANSAGVFPILPSAGTFYLGGDMIKYNYGGRARTDMLFAFDTNLYSFDGSQLVQYTS